MRTSGAEGGRTNTGAGSLTATHAEELDRACDRFEAAWRGGLRPKIEEHLAVAEESLRSALLGELIAIELDWRRRQGDEPGQDEYGNRFSDHAGTVAAAFDAAATRSFRASDRLGEIRSAWKAGGGCDPSSAAAPSQGSELGSSSGSDDGFGLDSRETTDHESTARPSGAALAAELRHERFQIGAKLGEGGMGVVYRARDSRKGRDVALKVMKTALAGTARRRFEREFRSLSALRHPHCLGVYDYGEVAGGPFFTMELFLGQPITSRKASPNRSRSRSSGVPGTPYFSPASGFGMACPTPNAVSRGPALADALGSGISRTLPHSRSEACRSPWVGGPTSQGQRPGRQARLTATLRKKIVTLLTAWS